jgi:hypothetical protein
MRPLPSTLAFLDNTMREAGTLRRLGPHDLFHGTRVCEADYYRRTGDLEKADDHLTAAAAMYREMDMGFWLEQAEVERRGSP